MRKVANGSSQSFRSKESILLSVVHVRYQVVHVRSKVYTFADSSTPFAIDSILRPQEYRKRLMERFGVFSNSCGISWIRAIRS